MAEAQIPRLADLASPAVTTLVTHRLRAVRHIATGRYGDVIAGWRSQAALCRARCADEVIAARRALAKGAALRQLAAYEYFAELSNELQTAVGECTLKRTITNASQTPAVTFTPGVIAKGTRIRRAADPDADPPLEVAEYETTEPLYLDTVETSVYADGPDWVHVQTSANVPLRAIRAGAFANAPLWDDSEPAGEFVKTPFDATLTVGYLRAAGGSNGLRDAQVAAYAGASFLGRRGPTADAVVAGALSTPGVHHAVYVEDPLGAQGLLYLADASWAYSAKLQSETLKRLRGAEEGSTEWLGFGSVVGTRGLKNYRIIIEATVMLRSADYADDTEPITMALIDKLKWYFNERADFWTWSKRGIATALMQTDRRVLTVASANIAVLDPDGAAVSEPALTIDPGTMTYLPHYHLSRDGARFTYTTPT